jgi:hypothetical protein
MLLMNNQKQTHSRLKKINLYKNDAHQLLKMKMTQMRKVKIFQIQQMAQRRGEFSMTLKIDLQLVKESRTKTSHHLTKNSKDPQNCIK